MDPPRGRAWCGTKTWSSIDEEIGRPARARGPSCARGSCARNRPSCTGPGVSDDGARAARARGRHRAQRLGEPGRVVIDALHARLVEQVRQDALADEPVLQHVGDAGRRAQVVLEDAEGPVRIADEVDARDVDAHAARGPQAADAASGTARSRARGRGGRARLEDALVAVDVVEEEAERAERAARGRAPGGPSPPRRAAAGRGRTGRSSRCRADPRRPRT